MSRFRNTHPEDVRAMIRKKGITMSELAARHGLHPSAISHSLRRCIPAANEAVAAFLRRPPSQLWPEWFNGDGSRVRDEKDAARAGARTSSQIEAADADERRAA